MAGTSLRLAFSCPASLRKFLILSSGTDLRSDSPDLGEELDSASVWSHSNYQGLGISSQAGPGKTAGSPEGWTWALGT